jgi:FHS family Na+ dependent glucose MFS transporter 1
MDKKSQKCNRWSYYAILMLLGLAGAALGPSLPSLAEGTGSTLTEIGNTFPSRAGAYLMGSWIAGRLYDRFPGNLVLKVSLLLMGVALCFVPLMAHLPGLIMVLIIMGLGMGALDVGGNTLLLWMKSDHPQSAMNALHFFYGLGSFLSPLILAAALQFKGGIQLGYWVYGALTLPVFLVMLSVPSPQPPEETGEEGNKVSIFQVVCKYPLLLIAIFYFLYVGVEVGFGGWIYTYALQTSLATETTAALLTSVFWGAFTLSRLLSIPLAARLDAKAFLGLDLLGALFSLSLILLWPSSKYALWGGAIGLGFAIASVFPTMLSFANQHLRLKGKETSWLFVSSGLGAMFTPWFMSRFVAGTFPLMIILLLLAALLLACLLFGALLIWSQTREGTGER